MFNPNKLRLRPFTGKDGFLSLSAAKLRCNAWIGHSINPFSTRALPSSSGDDDFSELGSPVQPKSATSLPKLMTEKHPKAATSLPKLMTEKPEPYNKKAERKKKTSGVPLASSNSLKRDSTKMESAEASKRVLSDAVSVNCFDPTIYPVGDKEAVKIRITNINLETTDSAIHSMCTSYGSLEGLVRTKEDAVDAFFSIKDNADIDSLLAKLNDTVMNDHKWSANLHQSSTPAVTSKQSIANLNVGLHISHQLAELRRQVTMKTVYVEDLEYLHHALVHLEAHPDSMTSISEDD